MATNKPEDQSRISPIFWIGLVVAWLMLVGCQATDTPDEVAKAFWQAVATNDMTTARHFSTQQTTHLTTSPDLPDLQHASLKVGEIVINEQKASVEILVTSQQNKISTLQTLMVKVNDHWKVDYQATLNHLQHLPFEDFLKSLENMGGTINEQLEQGATELGKELKKQVDEFERELQRNMPSKSSPAEDSI